MVVRLFSEQRDARHEGKGLGEIGEHIAPLDAIAAALPAGNTGQGGDNGVVIELRDHRSLAIGGRLSYLPAMLRRQTAPTLVDIEAMALDAIERLPELFRRHLGSIVLRVEDFPDDEVVAAMELDSEWDILGLYQGRHVGMKGDEPSGALPDMIFLYRRPILDEWVHGEDSLDAIVTHVLVHEVGHHFGLSDAAMEAIEAAADAAG